MVGNEVVAGRHKLNPEASQSTISCSCSQNGRICRCDPVLGSGTWPEPTIFNLSFHLAPFVDNEVWRQNVRQLLRRRHVFNGRKLIGVALGAGLHDLETVRREFGDWASELEFVAVPNDHLQREATTFIKLFEILQKTSGPEYATFRAHAKGVHRSMPGVVRWRDSMYHHLLDDMPKVVELLQRFRCVGCYRMRRGIGRQPWLLKRVPWFFSGSFFWVRDRALFGRDWQRMPGDSGFGHAVEAYPGTHFTLEESACVHGDAPERNPYYMTAKEARIADEVAYDIS